MPSRFRSLMMRKISSTIERRQPHATARPAAAGAGAPSARGPWPASAARRPRASRPAAPGVRAAAGKRCKHLVAPASELSAAGARSPPRCRFSSTVMLGEDLPAFGHLHDAELGDAVRRQCRRCRRRRSGSFRPSGLSSPEIAAHGRGLARAVGADQADDARRPRTTRSMPFDRSMRAVAELQAARSRAGCVAHAPCAFARRSATLVPR